jgi:hypothetical protein
MLAAPAPPIAALILRARRKIVGHFFALHAVTAEEAVPFVPQSLVMRRQFEHLQALGVVRQAAGGFWIDTVAYQADSERRRRRMVPIVILVALILAAIPLFFY